MMSKSVLFLMALFHMLLGGCASGASIGPSHRDIASANVQDVAYEFDPAKLAAAQDEFHFLRSYVDYFYLLLAKNTNALYVSQLQEFAGWCVGDAHPENFGVLLQKDDSGLFTVNDMDDAGPCPVVDDLLRLMTASTLYNSDVKVEKILNSYLGGLQNKNQDMPSPILKLIRKAEAAGKDPNPNKVHKDRLIRFPGAVEVDESLQSEIRHRVQDFFPKYEIVDMLETAKVGGGSGGLTRFEILLNSKDQKMEIEMKREIRPSIYPVATSELPSTETRLTLTMNYEQVSPSPFFRYAKVADMEMLVRPLCAGNEGLSLEKQSLGEDKDIIYYEAYVLGGIHRKSLNQREKYIEAMRASKASQWQSDVLQLADQVRLKFHSLKGNH